jgi:uncharacterized protein YjbJ (UPF0337 family)
MNWDRIKGNWKQLKGRIRGTWGNLTDDEVEQIAGKKDRLVGAVQARHGLAKDEVERQVDKWAGSCNC